MGWKKRFRPQRRQRGLCRRPQGRRRQEDMEDGGDQMTMHDCIGSGSTPSSRRIVHRHDRLNADRFADGRCLLPETGSGGSRDPEALTLKPLGPRLLHAGMTAMGLLLLSLNVALPSDKNVGTSGAAFLKIGPGARPAGMGEAFTGVSDDIHAIYWNPAGLGTIKTPEITGMHMQYFQSIQYEFAAFAYPTKEHGTLGFAVTNLHTDNIERRTEDTDT